MRILILGASGMLGHVLLYELAARGGHTLQGTVRNKTSVADLLPACCAELLREGVDAYNFASVKAAVRAFGPDVIVNCIGLIRQQPEGRQSLPCIELNARFPHLLLGLCKELGVRLIHYSTDCVFDGHKGEPYMEEDPPSAKDVYGLTKYFGELHEAPALTIRTSIIGPELRGKLSLIEWFLAQCGQISGYTHAIYTGLPTCEQARVLTDYILPRPDLHGLYHVASTPISKYELLQLVATAYGKIIHLEPDSRVREDKRLCGDKFASATGYVAPAWTELIRNMREGHRRFIEEARYAGDSVQAHL